MPITLFTVIKAASDHLPLPPVVRSAGQYYVAVWGIAKPMVWKAQECVHAAAVRAGMGNFMATLQRPAQRQCCVGAARSSGLEAQVSPWKESFHRTSSPVLAPLSDLCAIEQEDKVGTSDCRRKHRWLRHSKTSLRVQKTSTFKIWFLGQQKVPMTRISACTRMFPRIQIKSRSSSVCPALSAAEERLLCVQGLRREIPYVLQKGWERGTSTH